MITRDYLETHYSNILLPNKNAILSGGVIDENLINAADDNRWSLVLLLRISPDISDKIEETIEELKEIEPNQYYYPKQDFHITIARFMNKIENPMELLSYVEKEHYFGKMKVDSIEFAFHNWYDTRKKVLGEFTLS